MNARATKGGFAWKVCRVGERESLTINLPMRCLWKSLKHYKSTGNHIGRQLAAGSYARAVVLKRSPLSNYIGHQALVTARCILSR